MKYTADDYERTAAVVRDFSNDEGDLPLDPDRVDRLLSALKTAALVHREGVIEGAYATADVNRERGELCALPSGVAAAIRKAVGAE